MKRQALIAVALAAATAMLAPGSAHAAGPTDVCYNSVAVSDKSVPGHGTVTAMFSYDGVVFLSGQFIQNGERSVSTYWSAWRTQIPVRNKIIIGALNDQQFPSAAYGWLVETWAC